MNHFTCTIKRNGRRSFFSYDWSTPPPRQGWLRRALVLNPSIIFAAAMGLVVSCDAALLFTDRSRYDEPVGGLSARPVAVALSSDDVARITAAIYRVEGGDKTRFPYGVKSVKVKDKAEAKRVTENSVRNNWRRWQAAGCPGAFTDFMADRWCPVAADPKGNANWKRNMAQILSGQPTAGWQPMSQPVAGSKATTKNTSPDH